MQQHPLQAVALAVQIGQCHHKMLKVSLDKHSNNRQYRSLHNPHRGRHREAITINWAYPAPWQQLRRSRLQRRLLLQLLLLPMAHRPHLHFLCTPSMVPSITSRQIHNRPTHLCCLQRPAKSFNSMRLNWKRIAKMAMKWSQQTWAFRVSHLRKRGRTRKHRVLIVTRKYIDIKKIFGIVFSWFAVAF